MSADLTEKFKKSKTFFTGDSFLLSDVPYFISTGVWPLDAIIGGGLPGGKMIELAGDPSTGKSLLALYVIAEMQKQGGDVLYLDKELSLSKHLAQRAGIDLSKLVVAYPETIEQVHNVIMDYLDMRNPENKPPEELPPALIVWDSVAATPPQAVLTSSEDQVMEKHQIALVSRAMSRVLQVLPQKLANNNTTALFINQTRVDINVSFGDPTVTPGGRAWDFHAYIRIMLTSKKDKSNAGDIDGIIVNARINKNKMNRPFINCEFPFNFETATIDNAQSCLLYLKTKKIVKTSGAWSSIDINGEEIKFQNATWKERVFDLHADKIKELIYGHNLPDRWDEPSVPD